MALQKKTINFTKYIVKAKKNFKPFSEDKLYIYKALCCK